MPQAPVPAFTPSEQGAGKGGADGGYGGTQARRLALLLLFVHSQVPVLQPHVAPDAMRSEDAAQRCAGVPAVVQAAA